MDAINWHSVIFLVFALLACVFALAVVFTRRSVTSRFRRCRSIGPSVAACRSGRRCAS